MVHKLTIFYYLVTWFFIILNAFFIFKVISILNFQSNLTQRRRFLLSAYHVIKWFSIVQIICIIPSTVRRMCDLLGEQSNFILTMSQTQKSESEANQPIHSTPCNSSLFTQTTTYIHQRNHNEIQTINQSITSNEKEVTWSEL